MLVQILQTFKKLEGLAVENVTILAQDFFDVDQDEAAIGVRELTTDTPSSTLVLILPFHTLQFKTWESKDLSYVMFAIARPTRDWCPPDVVSEKDDFMRGIGLLNENLEQQSYSLYNPVKAQLDTYPKLDQSGIRFTYS